ncbi:hypothetical protein GDO81_027353 [Engystomops pustulosus]|uniref:Uncharacterized protein n=1 Tax=Engystomops pustulosus TaxID=76066 RepID=A0AAV6Z4E2_ENGPU|nr:hypothetical protein GDO81_027353 [Engystomops pustulosus]
MAINVLLYVLLLGPHPDFSRFPFFSCSSGLLPWGQSLAERLIFRPARVALGLDRCTRCYAGMEPIRRSVTEYFGSLGIDLLDLYGNNETSGVQNLKLPSSRTGRSELAGCKSRESQEGLCLWGRHIFLGYLGLEQETHKVFTEDGWFIAGNGLIPSHLSTRIDLVT